MWREHVAAVAPNASFSAPADRAAIADAERALGGPLPPHLLDLLLETDGIIGEYELAIVWPLSRIVADNVQFRTFSDFQKLYMPFDPLLFFADAGNGDQFAFAWRIDRDDVFVWDHETDSRRWVAPNLQGYLGSWLSGTLRI